MARKISVVHEQPEQTVEPKSEEVLPIGLEFHREDLNLLRDKINEVIAKINA